MAPTPEELKEIVTAALPAEAGIDETYHDYIIESLSSVLDAGVPSGDMEITLTESVGPLLESFISEDEVAEFVKKVVADLAARTKPKAKVRRKDDYAIQLDGFILGFGGKMLLESTQLHMKRGHRYALIGHNGAGKTTLMTRMAKKDIRGFPQDQTCVYVKHEVAGAGVESVVDFLKRDSACTDTAMVKAALTKVGFSEEMMKVKVSELSGGWRMRLAISRTLLLDADILLLDEPTNHLDVHAVQWLVDYLNGLEETTVMVVSHDVPFLEKVVTDVIHFKDKQLTYVPGGLQAFLEKNPLPGMTPSHSPMPPRSGAPARMDDNSNMDELPEFRFPAPGMLDGITSSSRSIMKLTHVDFEYDTKKIRVLHDVNVKLTLSSRVAIVGPNGAGKSTLMRILVGELNPVTEQGDVWKHHNLRVAYVAQHTLFHLEEHLAQTPIEYFQERFRSGADAEIQGKTSLRLSEEEVLKGQTYGEVECITGRRMRHRALEYEIKRVGIREKFYHPLEKLKTDPTMMKLVKAYDEKLAAVAAGVDLRPLRSSEIKKHLADFGLKDEFVTGKIERLSGGQRTRLVFAAAMWPRPHVLALDEPTNYLDREALSALAEAIRRFKGAVVMVTHNEMFYKDLCNEWWSVQNGYVTVQRDGPPEVEED